jgi:hypothetical protein
MPALTRTTPVVPSLPSPAAQLGALHLVNRAVARIDQRPLPEVQIPTAHSDVHAETTLVLAQITGANTPKQLAATPTARLGQAAADATAAIRLLQARSVGPDSPTLDPQKASSAIALLAGAAARLSTAPTDDAVASARRDLVQAASTL